MTDPAEIRILTVKDELRVCPACGQDRGFHVSFLSAGPGRERAVRSTREIFRVILICPGCGARFDAGWRVPLNDTGDRVVKAGEAPLCVPHGSPAACLPQQQYHDPKNSG